MDTPCSVDTMNETEPYRDGRWKGDTPRQAPDDMPTLTRAQAAELLGVAERTITRYVTYGYLTKYCNRRMQVVFSRKEVRSMLAGTKP